MANAFLTASIVAIVPAMLSLWWILKRYEDYFQDAKVFFALMVGLFAGSVVAFMENAVFGFHLPQNVAVFGAMSSLLWAVVGYALFESGAKAAVLGLKRYGGRPDTPFYGVPLGLAMGAMVAVQAIGAALQAGEANGRPYQFLPFLTMVAVPVGITFVHGATGAWVGKGAAEGRLGRGWATAMGLQMPALAISWWAWQGVGYGNVVELGPAVLALAYGGLLLWFTRRRLLDRVVPPEIADQVRRDRRRQARMAGRDGRS